MSVRKNGAGGSSGVEIRKGASGRAVAGDGADIGRGSTVVCQAVVVAAVASFQKDGVSNELCPVTARPTFCRRPSRRVFFPSGRLDAS